MGNLTSNGTKDGYISFRRLTQLEKDAGDIFLTKRDKENIIQIGRKVRIDLAFSCFFLLLHAFPCFFSFKKIYKLVSP